MNAVDLIAHDATDLPEAPQAEVLGFIGDLKTRRPQARDTVARDAKLAELTVFFARYRKDFGTFDFDRGEANVR